MDLARDVDRLSIAVKRNTGRVSKLPRPYIEIVELRIPRNMTDEEELACQSILYPSIPRNPTQADTINWHRVKHNNKRIEKARRQTSYSDWSVEAHTMDSLKPRKPVSKLSSRPSGRPAVFRSKDSKPAVTDSENDEYTPADQIYNHRQQRR
jgi:hypothetical protein